MCVSPVHQWHHWLICLCHTLLHLSTCLSDSLSLYSSSTHSNAVYCTLVPLSLSLACCSRAILSPSFLTRFHSIVLSMVPDLCIDYLNIPNFWGKFLSYVFYGIGKWIFWVLINTVQSIAVCGGSKEMLLHCHSAKMPWTVTFPGIHYNSCCLQKSVVSHTHATPMPDPYPLCVWTIPGLVSCQSVWGRL